MKYVTKEQMFFHGEAYNAPMECYGTMHQLSFQPPSLDEPKTQAFMWTGDKMHNQTVREGDRR